MQKDKHSTTEQNMHLFIHSFIHSFISQACWTWLLPPPDDHPAGAGRSLATSSASASRQSCVYSSSKLYSHFFLPRLVSSEKSRSLAAHLGRENNTKCVYNHDRGPSRKSSLFLSLLGPDIARSAVPRDDDDAHTKGLSTPTFY